MPLLLFIDYLRDIFASFIYSFDIHISIIIIIGLWCFRHHTYFLDISAFWHIYIYIFILYLIIAKLS